jgi:hypothetical protein
VERLSDHLRKNWLTYLVTVIYALLLALVISRHEPWFDEAQSWLLARDNSPMTLVTKYLRYEGTPGLWQLILMVPAKLGLPYGSLKVVSWIMAVAGIHVFMRFAPFPNYVKIILPFSFFLFYQYAVVARSYVLLPLLLFLVAAIWDRKMERMLAFTVLACLLANVCTQGLVIAAVLFGVHLQDLRKAWPGLDGAARRRQVYAVLAFAVVCLLVVAMLLPPRDLDFPAFKSTGISALFHSRTKWKMLSSSLTDIPFLSAAVLLLSALWFWRRRVLLLYLALTLALLATFIFAYANVWHEGILLLAWLFVTWVSFQEREERAAWSRELPSRKLRQVMCGALVVVAIIQANWSFNSARYDWSHKYSASREIADYIKENHMEGDVIYANGWHPVSILPYFKRNIFDNYNGKDNPSFWFWSEANNMVRSLDLMVADGPDWIIWGVKFPGEDILPAIEGYELVRYFDGALYWKYFVLEKDAFALYRRIGT